MLPRCTSISNRRSALLAGSLRASLAVVLVFAVGICGCRQGVYTPHNLPPEFAARPVIDVQSLDLGRMAGRATRNESIYPGDTLEVLTATGAEEEKPNAWELRVVEDGSVDVPLVGPVVVAGANLVQAEHVIRDACMRRRVFRKPNVRVKINQRRVNRVTVTGAVKKPETYELPAAGSNLAAALFAAGGLSDNADHIIEVRQPTAYIRQPADTAADGGSYDLATAENGERDVFHVDLVAAVNAPNEEIQLRDGAVVAVRPRPDRVVHMIGLTGNREIQLPRDRNVRLLEAIAQAGGPRYSPWISDKVKVVRPVPGSDATVTIKVSMRAAKREGEANILLAPGDLVSVEENVLTFTLSTLGSLVGIGTSAATGAAVGL